MQYTYIYMYMIENEFSASKVTVSEIFLKACTHAQHLGKALTPTRSIWTLPFLYKLQFIFRGAQQT